MHRNMLYLFVETEKLSLPSLELKNVMNRSTIAKPLHEKNIQKVSQIDLQWEAYAHF